MEPRTPCDDRGSFNDALLRTYQFICAHSEASSRYYNLFTSRRCHRNHFSCCWDSIIRSDNLARPGNLSVLALHLTLFGTAFLSATLLPGSSEVLLAVLIVNNRDQLVSLVIVAVLGNTLGAFLNWVMGRTCFLYLQQHWSLFSQPRINKALASLRTHGAWVLLFSWMPIFGDPLTVAAGFAKVPFVKFALLVLIGKAARYIVLAAFVEAVAL